MGGFIAWLTGTFWPSVWPNLAASLIWSVPTWVLLIWHHLTVRRHHREISAHLSRIHQSTSTTGGAANVQGER